MTYNGFFLFKKLPFCFGFFFFSSIQRAANQTCISDVIFIFIAEMVCFWRNSTTTNLASPTQLFNKHEDLSPSRNTQTKKTNLFVKLLLVKICEFPLFKGRISLQDCDHM